jgi:hypothetical protein
VMENQPIVMNQDDYGDVALPMELCVQVSLLLCSGSITPRVYRKALIATATTSTLRLIDIALSRKTRHL